VCVEASSGKEMWRQKGLMGNLIIVERYLVMRATGGQLMLARATPDAYSPLAFAREPRVSRGEEWRRRPRRSCPTKSGRRRVA
jgi:hypothetical protein